MSLVGKTEIVDVIRNYHFRVGTIESFPTFHILKTDRGPKVLKIWDDLNLLEHSFHFREMLSKAGFRKIERFIRTKDNQPYVIYKNQGFTLSDLIDGINPTVKREKDMEIIGEALGEFHLAINKLDINNEKNFKPWSIAFEKGLENLNHVEKKIKQKDDKTMLDKSVEQELTKYKKQMNQSIQMAKKVEKSYFDNEHIPKWCHGNIDLNSFRLDEYGEGWIIDLGLPVVDVPTYDIAKLTVSIYKKSGYSLDVVDQMLRGYESKNRLEKVDKYWILTYAAYPHDLWKFLYVYYVKKLPKLENLENRFKSLVDEQIKMDELYQHLFTYFEI